MKPKNINQEKVDEIVKNINDDDKEISWEEGNPRFKSKKKIKSGKSARARGARFELKVRKDLEEKGWTVDKFSNNVDMEIGKIVPAKRKYNPFSKVMTIGTGFPDFITIKKIHSEYYSVIGVEVKMNGTLSKIEKEKCQWYLENEIFSKIWIAKEKQVGRKIEIEYVDFKEKYIDKNKNK